MRRRLVLVLAWLKPCPSLNLCGCDLLGLASFQSTSKIKVKSRGQECPRHTRNPSPHLPARRRRYLRAPAGTPAAHALVAASPSVSRFSTPRMRHSTGSARPPNESCNNYSVISTRQWLFNHTRRPSIINDLGAQLRQRS